MMGRPPGSRNEKAPKLRLSKRNTTSDGKCCAHCSHVLIWTLTGNAEHPSPVCDGWKGSGGAVKVGSVIFDENRNYAASHHWRAGEHELG